MPVTKKRPHIYELLNFAVEQKQKLLETRIEILERPASIWLTQRGSFSHVDNNESRNKGRRGAISFNFNSSYISTFYTYLTYISRYCEKFLVNRKVKLYRALFWPLAFAIMVYEAPQADLSINNSTDEFFHILDYAINAWFLLDSIIRLLGVYIRIKIERAFHREVVPFEVFTQSGFTDIVVTFLCFSFGLTTIGLWFRWIRLILITTSVLDMFPHIDVLMSGISNGLRSVFFTIILLFLLQLTYGSLGHILFHSNDPFHFGTYGLSFLTFFQLSTFENWSTIYYINYYGCANYQSEYDAAPAVSAGNATVETYFGTFELPRCTNSHGQPIAATFVFCSYAILAGYVIVSMCLAAVAIGINERLDDIRKLSLYGDADEDMAPKPAHPPHRVERHNDHGQQQHGNNMAASKASKLLGSNKEAQVLKAMLKKVWEGKENLVKASKSESSRNSIFSGNLSLRTLAMDLRLWQKNHYYLIGASTIIIVDAVIQMVDESNGATPESQQTHLALQVLLLIDTLMKILSHQDKPIELFKDYWGIFDIFITSILLIPSISFDNPDFRFLGFLRIFRLSRVLKNCSFITDLGIILNAMGNSFICLIFVIALILLYFFYFAIAGILLFRDANPYYFSDLGNTLQTLMQVMTMDNWSDVMRKCMLGCRYFGFDTDIESYNAKCFSHGASGKGVGWWAAIYFTCFIILSAMVLSSLLVGVIITSMELLREDVNEEGEIWKKVRVVQSRYEIDPSTVDLLLELFEKVDKNSNGHLTFEELRPIMDLVNMSPNAQFTFYMRVDTDKSGQIDFAEFCEMIILMGMSDEHTRSNKEHHRHGSSGHSMRHSIESAIVNVEASIVNSVRKVFHSDGSGKNHSNGNAEMSLRASFNATAKARNTSLRVSFDASEGLSSPSSKVNKNKVKVVPLESVSMRSDASNEDQKIVENPGQTTPTKTHNIYLPGEYSSESAALSTISSVADVETGHPFLPLPLFTKQPMNRTHESEKAKFLTETTKQLTMRNFNLSMEESEKTDKSSQAYQWYLDNVHNDDMDNTSIHEI